MDRYKDFDIAKGLASYLVVLGHLLSQIGNSKVIIITFCHMPLFFFISGYLMYFSIHKYGATKFVKKKFYSLFIPYIIWSFISFGANILVEIRNEEIFREEFIDIFLRARSVWFLIELFISLAVFVISLYIAKRIKANQYVIGLIVWLIIALYGPNDLFSFVKFKWLFPFVIIGYLLAERKSSIKIPCTDKYIVLRGVIVLFPMIALCAYSEQYLTNYVSFYYTSIIEVVMGISYYFISICGICCIMAVANFISSYDLGRVFSEIGKYSIHIYVMHMFVVKFIFYVPSFIREYRLAFLYIYMPIYAALVVVLIVFLSKKILDKSKLFQVMIGRR